MDGIGKMYNPGSHTGGEKSRPSGWDRYYGGGSASRQPTSVPEHTENFYKALREASKEPEQATSSFDQPPEKVPRPSSGARNGVGFSLSGLTSLLKKLGDDDVLLLLLIILLFGENLKDDYPLLIILGILLLT